MTVVSPLADELGGAERMLSGFLRHAAQAGLELSVIFLRAGAMAQLAADLGHRVRVIEAGRLRDPHRMLSASGRLAQALRADRSDVALSWMLKAHLYVTPAARLGGYDGLLVWWQHAFPSEHWMDRLARHTATDAIACSSEVVARAQRLATPGTRVFSVHPGVDPQRFAAPAAGPRNAGGQGPFVVTIVGRLQPWKNQDAVLRAVAIALRDGHDVECRIVGGETWGLSAGYERSLRDLAVELGIADRVTFSGHIDDVRPHLHASSLVVNASAREPFGIVVLEAMAAGVPVAAVAGAGPAEVIEHGHTGLLMADPAPETIAAVIARLARDPALAQRIGAAAVLAACAHSERAMTARIAAELRRTIDGVAA